jgi:small subunit ribosomal protein S6
MRDYEVVYIFKSALGTEDIDARLQRYHEKILAVDGSEITAVEHWGKRQLAYPIDRNENGYYVVAQFSTEPRALPEFERLLKLDEEVLRHLVVLSEGELAVPVSLGDDDEDDDRRRGGRGDDDDEKPRRDADGDSDGDKDEPDVEIVEGAEDEAGVEATAEIEEEADDDVVAEDADAGEDADDGEVDDGEDDEDEAGAEGDEDTDEEDKD